MLNSPSNPTGAVYPPDQVEAIGRWAVEHRVWVVCDEIYEHLVFGGAEHVSLPVVVPEARERCVVVNGVAKSYAMTGWRVGWSIAPGGLSAAINRLQSHTTSNVCNVAQRAALAALDGPFDPVAEMRDAFDQRRRLTVERLSTVAGVECAEPFGAFYVFPSMTGTFGRRVGTQQVTSSMTLCAALLDTVKVALVPGEGFGAPGYVRLSYALDVEDLTRGLDRIAEALDG